MTNHERIIKFYVILILSIHALLLLWQSRRYAATIDEPAHLAAGLSHWTFSRFDLYRVNPPLVRLLAALPVLLHEPKTDWRDYYLGPYLRPEFPTGRAFVNANGASS